MLGGIGAQEIILVAVLILLLFGAKQIPSYMRGIGQGIRELRRGLSEVVDAVDQAAEEANDAEA